MKRFFVYYFLFLFSFLSIFASGIVDSQDGFQYLAVARNIYYKGKPTAPPYEYNERKNIHMPIKMGKGGQYYGYTGLGFSLALVPAVALTDIVYRIYNISPPVHFPLENDWLILLTASFTNAFFGAILGVILLKYFILLGLNRKEAFWMSLVSIVATNLFAYTKHINAHMMFIVFMMLSFLFIKLYSIQKKRYLLLFSGISYGIFSLIYNPTFVLSSLPLVLYYLLLIKPKIKISSLKSLGKDVLFALIGLIPFLLIFKWFENLRAYSGMDLATPAYYNAYSQYLSGFPVTIFIEGLYGQLLSPGRSIFIYSPLLLIPILFWTKIRKSFHPELFAVFLLSAIYIVFYSLQYTVGTGDQGLGAFWHGENSWGPRYLTPLIPLGMFLVAGIYKEFSKKLRFFIFYPLIIIGIYVGLLGILMPYQTKYFNLQSKFIVNHTEYTVHTYSNLLPRYTPILNMSKNLVALIQSFPNTYNHGMYNVKFYDGIDFPFNVGPERWRVIENKGYISFDKNVKDPVKELTFGVINHPILQSSESAKLQFILNDTPLLEKPAVISVTQRELIKLQVPEKILKPVGNNLLIDVSYPVPMEIISEVNDKLIEGRKQILGIMSFDINGKRQNLESIDVPYVSSLGPALTGFEYQNWGGTNQDPWKTWQIHTQAFERLPDFWWLRNLYYWDIPKQWILIPFTVNLLLLLFFGYKLKKHLK